MREGKDSLALGNISGAMVFQSTIPVGIGLIFTDWDAERQRGRSRSASASPAACSPTRACTARGRFKLPAVIGWFALYAAFIVVVVAQRLSDALRRPASSASALSTSVVVLFRLNLREDPGDLALGVDDEGRAQHAHVLLAVHRLLAPGAVGSATAWSGSAEQGEVEVVFAGELLQRLDLVGGDADHPRAGRRVLGAAVADAAGLGRAAGGVGAGVEVEDDRLARADRRA